MAAQRRLGRVAGLSRATVDRLAEQHVLTCKARRPPSSRPRPAPLPPPLTARPQRRRRQDVLALTELDLVQMLDVDLATAAAVILAVSAAVAPPMRRVRG